MARYICEVAEIPYEGDVMNLSVKGSPTFQTPVGLTHNTVKPIAIMDSIMIDLPKGASIVDPFLGSGSTGLAALKRKLNFTGIELEKDHLRVAYHRVHHADTATASWDAAEIESDYEEEESSESKSLTDFFGL
jgi:DNA modification methylase